MKSLIATPLNGSALEQRFWSLVSEYDRLLKEMAWAIELKDFDLLSSVQCRQDSILQAMLALEGILNTNPQATEALSLLSTQQLRHHQGLESLLHDLKKEARNLNRKAAASQQVLQTYSKSFETI